MPLSAGDKLGPFEILASIGAGGMGEVYKARDSRLDRVVAVKVSQERFGDRFEREAKAVAALNHPYICQLYDVGPNYLVMEFVEGETLRGPLLLDDALRIAGQIAEALAAAHEKGIVHRDLKPDNILIKPDGSVKVLDFGLAKVAPTVESAPAGEDSPTQAMNATEAGMILGTAAYMSPEQARGKSVTPRADIWAFGVVLYEMLVGRKLFRGEDLTEVLASVVKDQPDLRAAPQEVQRLLQACLEKDPKTRLQSIGDWKLLLDAPQAGSARNRTQKLWPALAAVLAIVGVYVSFIHFRETSRPADPMRLSVTLPPGTQPSYALLSRDGSRLLVNLLSQNKTLLHTRRLDAVEFHPLEGTEDARSPFWSADGRFIGFFADGKLKMISAAGGPVSILCGQTGLGAGGGAWSDRNVILYFTDAGIAYRVSPAGGECSALKTADENLRGSLPEFLPDGNHFLFLGANRLDSTIRGVYLGSLEGGKPRRVLNDYSSVVYSAPLPGSRDVHLLFLRASQLMAQLFDPQRLEAVGDPFAVAAQASSSLTPNQVAASVSVNGTLVYLSNRSRNLQLTWFDRSGKELGKIGESGERTGVSLSPDGNMVAFRVRTQSDPLGGIRLLDIARNSENRFTPEGKSASAVVWSPDGARIVYSAPDAGGTNLFMKNANGDGQEVRLLPASPNLRTASDWSADGRFLIYTEFDPQTGSHIWYLPSPGKPDSAPVRFPPMDVVGAEGQLSPDGLWLAYSGTADGIYVRRFPSGDGMVKIAGNAIEPRWSRTAPELFYLEFVNGGNEMNLMETRIEPIVGGTLQFSAPKKIANFRSRVVLPQNNQFAYSPHPDGKRFLINVRESDGSPEVNVITNWQRLVSSGKP